MSKKQNEKEYMKVTGDELDYTVLIRNSECVIRN